MLAALQRPGRADRRRQQPRAGRRVRQGNHRRGQRRRARPAGVVRTARRRRRNSRPSRRSRWRSAAGSSARTTRPTIFTLAVSLAQVRDMVRQYLQRAARRRTVRDLGAELADTEGATVERVAQMLKLMKPPLDVPEDAKRGPGLYEFTMPGLTGETDARYFVQLPPEYDPLAPLSGDRRRWPTPAFRRKQRSNSGPARRQATSGEPLGQATRHGYITIAVDWLAAAPDRLRLLGPRASRRARLAARRLPAVLDRHRPRVSHRSRRRRRRGVGHRAGASRPLGRRDAVRRRWPTATASATATNAKYVPWYFVGGELDGDKMAHNARELDRYFGRNYGQHGGRIPGPRLRAVRRRDAAAVRLDGPPPAARCPKEFECVTMRPWDNFFWWLEVGDLPEKSMVAPASWPPPRAARPFPRRRRSSAATNKITVIRAGRHDHGLARAGVRRLRQAAHRRAQRPTHARPPTARSSRT